MGKQFTTIISDFSGGLSEDKRVNIANKYSLTKHFDALTYPKKLVPHYKTGPGAQEEKTSDIVKFLYALENSVDPSDYVLFGLGKDTGDSKTRIRFLKIDDGSLATITWDDESTTNLKSGAAGRKEQVFFYYKSMIYFWRTRYLVQVNMDGSTAVDDTFYDATAFTYICQPVHHPSDDIAYFFHDNFVHKLNDTSWTAKVLTLPSDSRIVAACAHGNYLAIATTTKPANGADAKSIVYLWDRDSSFTTLTERIDFGRGEIIHLASLNGRLTAIVNFFANSIGSGVGYDKGKVYVKQYFGGQFATIVNELTTDDEGGTGTANVFPTSNMVSDNKLYFPMSLNLDGDARLGIWVVDYLGRITLDFVEAEASSIEGIFRTGNVWWIAHSNDGSVNLTLKSYSVTNASIYESLIFDGRENRANGKTKKLIGVTVVTEVLPTAGQIVLKYRKDEETSWTTIFTEATNDSISFDAINISGATLPEFKEIQFQINSTGGAIVTGLKFKYEVIDKQKY